MKKEYFGQKHKFHAYLLINLQCNNKILTMMSIEQKTVRKEQEKTQEEQEIGLLREWLPKIDGECRAYIKGATEALLYAQEENQEMTVTATKKGVLA